jgi:hypothetical protein
MSKMHRGALALSLLLVACENRHDPVAVVSAREEAVTEVENRAPGLDGQAIDPIIDPFTPRLMLNIVAETSLSPKSEIVLRLEAVAAGPITSGQVSAMLPTQRPASGAKIPVVASWTLPVMVTGDTWKQRLVVGSVEDEGVYQATIDVFAQGPDAELGPYLLDNAATHSWMYVKGRGGSLLSVFDDSQVAANFAPQPGPFRARGDIAAPPDGSGAALPDGGGSVASWDSDDDNVVTVEVVHYDSLEYHAAEGAKINGVMVSNNDEDIDDEDETETYDRTVPEDGYVTFPCPSSNHYLAGSVNVPVTEEVTGASLRSYWEATSADCGDTIRVAATTNNYLPWKHLNDVIPLIDDDFGYDRSRVDFVIIPGKTGATFHPRLDQIWFGNAYGHPWVSAHEYVHALQHESLGGLLPVLPNCSPHPVDQETSYQCAFQEGLADYGGNIGTDEEDWLFGDWEDFDHGPDDVVTKGMVEGYVAAFFWDLTDDTSEEDDETEYDGSYIMEVYETCKAARPLVFVARDNVTDFVWCLENRINKSVHDANFPGVQAPSRVSESAEEPDEWDAQDIRTTWLLNLGGE